MWQWELAVILIIVLLGFGAHRLPQLARRMAESLRETEVQGMSLRPPIFFIGAVLAVLAPLTLWSEGVISGERAAGVFVVVAVWLIVGYFCFGRSSKG